MKEPNHCFHCHDSLPPDPEEYNGKLFCCKGCKGVYQLLFSHELGAFYARHNERGIRPEQTSGEHFAFLDEPILRQQLIDFQEGNLIRLTIHLPQIHCASCIYLLEHLNKINPAIAQSTVHFTKREATITVHTDQMPLSELALLLTKIGYHPNFNRQEHREAAWNKRLLLQLGVAGFAFGSIMLWSFPEYLGLDESYSEIRSLSSYLSLVVSLPVLLYSASDYFRSALGGLRTRTMNLDIPIVLGIIALYTRSTAAILSGEGPGYMDSFAAFIFFLLIGKWFQGKTYQWLSFDRDFRSYFPIAVIRITQEDEQLVQIEALNKDDRILIRNEEIVPCDSVLTSEKATIDYSFVTGEADWLEKQKGDLIYAGGRIIGSTAALTVFKTTTRSALTQLWNEQEQRSEEISFQTRQDRISRYFIAGVILLSLIAGILWWFIQPARIPEIVTSVLIVACPCALALSVPFVYGNMLRKLGRIGLYLRNASLIERIQQCDMVVFDKTGTLTRQEEKDVDYEGTPLTVAEKALICYATRHAHHPYAQAVYRFMRKQVHPEKSNEEVIEYPGKGIAVGEKMKLGSAAFTGLSDNTSGESVTYLRLNGQIIGRFIFRSGLREGVDTLINDLGKTLQLHVISGDKPRDLERLSALFPEKTVFRFEQQPIEKRDYIRSLHRKGHRVIMIGDGLNDAGALQEAFAGIALSENLMRFTPSSDAILKADNLRYFGAYYRYMLRGKSFLKWCFGFSIIYNITGIGFAMSGQLTPLVATILMPVSSITVVSLATFLTMRKQLPATKTD